MMRRTAQFFVASRAHHADIGGVTPGSMPPFSRDIEEEGVLIEDLLLVAQGTLRETQAAGLLKSGPHPVRDLAQNLSDLRAQVAANARGVAELERLVALFGMPVVRAYMQHVQDNAEEAVRRLIHRLRRRLVPPRARRRERDLRRGARWTGSGGRRRSTSRARPRSTRATSTPRPRSALRPCSTSSVPSSTPTSH